MPKDEVLVHNLERVVHPRAFQHHLHFGARIRPNGKMVSMAVSITITQKGADLDNLREAAIAQARHYVKVSELMAGSAQHSE